MLDGSSIGRRFWRLLFLILLAAVVYFSWKPSPAIAQVHWLPRSIGLWLDHHDFAKNLLGYGTLAFATLMAWSMPNSQREHRSLALCSVRERNLLIGFCSLVAFLELGQLALRYRTCDWADILAGWLGGLLAWGFFRLTIAIKANLA